MALKIPLSAIETPLIPTTVAVTGAAGYVASHVVHRLLAAGYTVHGTVRSKASGDFLFSLPGAEERLKLFEADLLKPGSFEAAFQGCAYVMHTASPFKSVVPKGKERETFLYPALRGTENVLDAVSKTPSIKRVVLTSSIAAMMSYPPADGHTITEADWNNVATDTAFPYEHSKTEAEKRAWEIARAQDRWSLVVVNPGFVLGPPLGPRSDSESVALITKLIQGKFWPLYPPFEFGLVDVRDVAEAHVLGMVRPEAEGRYICAPHVFNFPGVAGVLRSTLWGRKLWLPSVPMPYGLLWLVGPAAGMDRERIRNCYDRPAKLDNRKAQAQLGVTFLPVKDTILDMVEALQKLGMVKLPSV